MKAKTSEIMPAFLGTLLFLIIIIPFFLIWIPRRILLSPEQIYRFDIGVFRYLGLVPIVLGVVIYVFCSGSFVFIGKGTPIPFTPTKELIVTGFYRFKSRISGSVPPAVDYMNRTSNPPEAGCKHRISNPPEAEMMKSGIAALNRFLGIKRIEYLPSISLIPCSIFDIRFFGVSYLI